MIRFKALLMLARRYLTGDFSDSKFALVLASEFISDAQEEIELYLDDAMSTKQKLEWLECLVK